MALSKDEEFKDFYWVPPGNVWLHVPDDLKFAFSVDPDKPLDISDSIILAYMIDEEGKEIFCVPPNGRS